jgi:hypothetical protein
VKASTAPCINFRRVCQELLGENFLALKREVPSINSSPTQRTAAIKTKTLDS